jgi:D-alanyl-D-alanine carboxypeptidase/D-alanyl-D-alanine-endopeptidase (penicillin-binding protein 4)
LSSIVKDMNKFSNNFLAEQILKTLGAELKGPPGTSEKGLEILKQGLKEWGYKDNEYSLNDGSGFSLFNRFSPSQLTKILTNAYNDFRIGPDFISSLPLSGLDGSLKNRHMSSKIDNLVRAKTGTLDSASAISGYAGTDSGEKFVFSIIMNDFKCSTYKTWEIQSTILEGLLDIFSK